MSQQFERATGRSKTQRGLYLINAEAMRRNREKSFLLSLQLTNLSLNIDSSCRKKALYALPFFRTDHLKHFSHAALIIFCKAPVIRVFSRKSCKRAPPGCAVM